MADPGAVPPPGAGGPGGIPFGPPLGPGFGAGFDAGLFGGSGFLGGPFGGIGGAGGPWGGFGGPGWAPYVPSTILGSLGGIKGDLLVPILAIGVALFVLLLIFLVVKAALAWKVDLLAGLASKKHLRDVGGTPPPQDQDHMAQLSSIVMNALESQNCLDKIICSVGSYGQGASWPQYFSMLENLISEDYKKSLQTLKSCADGTAKVEQFQCGTGSQQPLDPSKANEVKTEARRSAPGSFNPFNASANATEGVKDPVSQQAGFAINGTSPGQFAANPQAAFGAPQQADSASNGSSSNQFGAKAQEAFGAPKPNNTFSANSL